MSETTVIQLNDASKWYGDVIGVNQINLNIGPGVTGLLGPNGAGKSTLLKMITGQLAPSRGTVQTLGEAPWQNKKIFSRIGYCPDSEKLYEDMTGLRFVMLMARLGEFDALEAKRRAMVELERVSMTPHMNRRIRGYSKGMRQRIKLAAALVHDPQLIVLDEPLNGLDPMGRIELLTIFRNLGREGKTVLISSHILNEIEDLTRHIVVLHRGRLLAEGNIEDVRALIDNQPLSLRIISPTPRLVAQTLADLESTASINFQRADGAMVEKSGQQVDALTIRSTRPEQLYEALQKEVLAGTFEISELTALDENLDAVFQYLVNE